MERTVQKFMGAMIGDFALSLDRQQQQTLAEWAVKCAMCNDTVDVHPRFFTDAECHEYLKTPKIPDRTLVFAAHFIGHSLDSNGVDFTLIEPTTGDLLVRGHVDLVNGGSRRASGAVVAPRTAARRGKMFRSDRRMDRGIN